MNKQALAFLTMFSLVLMLSVYYVTLPSDSTSVMSEDGKTSEKVNSDTDKENTSQKNTTKQDEAAKLQEEINQKKETEINSSSQVVADKNSKEEDKQDALSTMDEVKGEQQMQEQIKEALKKEKINTAVEIKDTTCTITIFDAKEDKQTAAKVMNIANGIVDQSYLIEVAFK